MPGVNIVKKKQTPKGTKVDFKAFAQCAGRFLRARQVLKVFRHRSEAFKCPWMPLEVFGRLQKKRRFWIFLHSFKIFEA